VRSLRGVVLGALIVVSAVVVVTSPAFATPRLTSSTGTRPDNGAVSPFITPIGNTTTSSARVTEFDGTFDTLTFVFATYGGFITTWTCTFIQLTGYVGSTHTQLRFTSSSISACGDDTTGAGVTAALTGVGSATPALVHMRSGPFVETEWTGSFNLAAGQTIDLRARLFTCDVRIQPQSISARYTNTTRGIDIRDNTVAFTSPGTTVNCPDPSRALASVRTGGSSSLILRPDTRNDAMRVTALSSQ
jgi:hypothetical protein